MPIFLPPLSRRQFLKRSLAGAAGWMLASRARATEPAVDPDCWALLSDPHIHANRARDARGINMAAQLTTVVNDVLGQSRRPVGALVNGDLAFNTGETADYALFTELVTPLRAAGIPLHLALGNHDHRERFWAALQAEPKVARPVIDRHVAIVSSRHANWFILDSLDKTNSTPGLIGEAQLAWLARELDARADKPAIVMTHHNPSPEPGKRPILDEEAFYAVVHPRRQVKAHVFGHSHRWHVMQDSAGLHRINLPTTAYVFDPAQPAAWVQARLHARGVGLDLRCVDPSRREHGQHVDLAWR